MTGVIWRKGLHCSTIASPSSSRVLKKPLSAQTCLLNVSDEAQCLCHGKIYFGQMVPSKAAMMGVLIHCMGQVIWHFPNTSLGRVACSNQLIQATASTPLVPQTGLFTIFRAMPFVSCGNRGAPSVQATSGELLNEPAITQKC